MSVWQNCAARLSEGCLAFDRMDDAFYEAAALTEESAMDEYLTDGALSEETLRGLIAGRRIFPCYFGSALRLSGVEELIAGLERWIQPAVWPASFGAKVYKISRDTQGVRLTHLKVTGGVLRVRDLLTGCRPGGSDAWEEKADQLRIYSGGKYTTVNEVPAGGVCAVTGPEPDLSGTGTGHRSGIGTAGTGTGADLPGGTAPGSRCPYGTGETPAAGGGRSAAPSALE